MELEDDFYTVCPETGKVIYDTSNPGFHTLKVAFARSGINILTLTTEDALHETWRDLRHEVDTYIKDKILAQDPDSLEVRLLQATLRGDDAEYERLVALLEKRQALGLRVVHTEKPD